MALAMLAYSMLISCAFWDRCICEILGYGAVNVRTNVRCGSEQGRMRGLG